MQKAAKEVEIEAAKNEVRITAEMLIKNVYPQFSKEKFPKTFKLLERSLKTSLDITKNTKEYWKMQRPFLSDKRIKALVEISDILLLHLLVQKFWDY